MVETIEGGKIEDEQVVRRTISSVLSRQATEQEIAEALAAAGVPVRPVA